MPTFVARQRPHQIIAARNPSPNPGLINLPLPLPSIPILNPVITPLIQGNNRPAAQQPSPTAAAPPPPPPPPPPPASQPASSPPSSGGGSSSSPPNGGGNSGGNTGGSNSGGNSNGGNSGGGDGSSSPNNGGSSSPSSGNPPTNNNGGGSNSGTGTTGGSGSPSDPSSPSSSGGVGTGTGTTGTGTGTSGADPPGGSSSSTLLGDGNAPVNAGTDPSSGGGGNTGDGTTGSGGGGTGTGTSGSGGTGGTGTGGKGTGNFPGVTGIPRVSGGAGGNGGTGGTGGGGNDGGNSGGTGANSKGGISGGAIAGIIIFILLLTLACSIFLLRRRRISRRSERRHKWWFTRKRNSQTYGDDTINQSGNSHPSSLNAFAAIGSGGSGGGGSGRNRRSVRSSFETTVDQSQTPPRLLDVDLGIPTIPPMAELRREPILLNLDNSPITSPQVTVPQFSFSTIQNTAEGTTTKESRFSVGTISSVGSDGQGQWLVVNRNSLMVPEIGTPMSVRPFSPTESFAFPKPPTTADKNTSGDWSSSFSRPGSSYTATGVSLRSPVLESAPVPALPVPSPIANPFSDPDPMALHAAAVAAFGIPDGGVPVPTGAVTRAAAGLTLASAPLKVKDPFADPTPTPPTPRSAVHPEFFEIEIIKRPFIPKLEDELMVDIADRVKILHMFDDGWALVEKNPNSSSGDVSGKGKGKMGEIEGEKGLIPIDCFRDPGVDVTDFIAAKRVSSYSQREGVMYISTEVM